MLQAQERIWTIEDIYALPEGKRAELMDGRIYDMAPPSTGHQRILMHLSAEIRNYIRQQQGTCEVFPAPFAVFLYADKKNYVEPDISVICDRDKINEKGCLGAPDWVIEIASPSTQQMDYGIKLFQYRTAGVREYWIVNPKTRTVNVFDFEREESSGQYSFEEEVPVCIYQGFAICISELL